MIPILRIPGLGSIGARNPCAAMVSHTSGTSDTVFGNFYYRIFAAFYSSNSFKRYGKYRKYRKRQRSKGFLPYTSAALFLRYMGSTGLLPPPGAPPYLPSPSDQLPLFFLVRFRAQHGQPISGIFAGQN